MAIKPIPQIEFLGAYLLTQFAVPTPDFTSTDYAYKLKLQKIGDSTRSKSYNGTKVQVSTDPIVEVIRFAFSLPDDDEDIGYWSWRFYLTGDEDSPHMQTAGSGRIDITKVQGGNTFAYEQLQAVETVIKQKIEDRADVTSYMIGGRNIATMSLEELYRFRNQLREEVSASRGQGKVFRKWKRIKVV